MHALRLQRIDAQRHTGNGGDEGEQLIRLDIIMVQRAFRCIHGKLLLLNVIISFGFVCVLQAMPWLWSDRMPLHHVARQ